MMHIAKTRFSFLRHSPRPINQIRPRASFASRSTLVPKPPSASWVERFLPFSTDLKLRDAYKDTTGSLRIGQVLEELDLLAASVAYVHADGFNANRPLWIVTAAVDRIQMHSGASTLPLDRDLVLQGAVTYVGRSSMEIKLDVGYVAPNLADKNGVPLDSVMSAYFQMVARDMNNKPAEVPGLLPQSEAEQLAFEMGALNKKRRVAEAELSLAKSPPSSDERLLVHQLYLTEQQLKRHELEASSVTYMHQTKLQNVMFMYPQSRNVFGKVFGGWLMREAYELAWLTASLFSKSCPTFLCIDDIHFIEPVEIGVVLELNSVVAYVGDDNSVHTRVQAQVLDPRTGIRKLTNTFQIAFSVDSSIPLQKLIPRTYADAMDFVYGQRAYQSIKTMSAAASHMKVRRRPSSVDFHSHPALEGLYPMHSIRR